MKRAGLVLASALACAPALHARAPAAGAARPAAEGGDASELLARARAHLARRAEPGEARQAELLFLAAAERDPRGVEGLYGAVQARILRIDREPGADRKAIAAEAVDAGQACLERAPESATCHYALALAVGVQARERRATALDGVKQMVPHLRLAAERDPGLDQAGPERVLALVLARAPGWPLGPGDPEEAALVARRAVQLAPDYPPNLLALAEALLGTGQAAEAQDLARQAVALARALAGDPEAEGWAKEGEALLARAGAAPGA